MSLPSCSVMSDSLPTRLLSPWDSPGKDTRVGCHFLLQSYGIREMQIKTTMRYQYIPTQMAKVQNTDTTKYWQGCEATGTLVAGLSAKRYRHLVDSPAVVYKTKHAITTGPSSQAPWWPFAQISWNSCPHKTLDVDIYGSFIHSRQNLHATKKSFSRWVDK